MAVAAGHLERQVPVLRTVVADLQVAAGGGGADAERTRDGEGGALCRDEVHHDLAVGHREPREQHRLAVQVWRGVVGATMVVPSGATTTILGLSSQRRAPAPPGAPSGVMSDADSW